MNLNFSSETNFEQENNENWVRDASLITNVEANYNEKFKYTFNSAFQTSPTYLRRTDQNNMYKFIIGMCYKDANHTRKKKLEIKQLKLLKKPSINFLLFIFFVS